MSGESPGKNSAKRRKRWDDAALLRRKVRIAAANMFRRERERAGPGDTPPNRGRIRAIVHRIYKYWRENGRICYLCGKPIGAVSEASLDHAVPLSRGGASSVANLGIAHRRCNVIKGIMTLEEYGKFVDAIRSELPELVCEDVFRRLYAGGRFYRR